MGHLNFSLSVNIGLDISRSEAFSGNMFQTVSSPVVQSVFGFKQCFDGALSRQSKTTPLPGLIREALTNY